MAVGAAIGSVAGGLFQASAAKKGASAQAGASKYAAQLSLKASREANKLQKEIYYDSMERMEPWRERGENALAALNSEMGLGARPKGYDGFEASPGYQFRLQEGQNALERGMNASGLYGSGAMGRALSDYGQGTASAEYGDHMNRLASLAGLGQTAMQSMNQAGQSYAGAVGNNLMTGAGRAGSAYMNAGAAQAQGYAGMSAGFNSTLNNLSGVYGMARGGLFGPNPGFGIQVAGQQPMGGTMGYQSFPAGLV